MFFKRKAFESVISHLLISMCINYQKIYFLNIIETLSLVQTYQSWIILNRIAFILNRSAKCTGSTAFVL